MNNKRRRTDNGKEIHNNDNLRPYYESGSKLSIKYTKLEENAIKPKRATKGSAGYDLFYPEEEDCMIKSNTRKLIPTNIGMNIPDGYYGRIAGRSSLAMKYGILIGGGVIDSDYTGNIGIIMVNTGDTDYTIKKGEKIAQLIIEKCLIADLEHVEELQITDRGDGGFGSTGK